MSETKPRAAKPTKTHRPASDVLLLFGTALLVTAVGVTFLALIEKYEIPEFWYWGTVLGPATFLPGARYLRTKFRQRAFLYYCAGWFPVHMAVMYVAAAHLPIIIALFPVALELFLGFNIAYWLFGPPAGAKKLSQFLGHH